jgi:hypothetical protein
MAKAANELSDRDLFFSHLIEFLDDSLPGTVKDRVVKFSEANKDIPNQYQYVRGKLQLALQSIYLNEDETLELRRLIRNHEDRLSMDELRITQVGRKEFWSQLRRQLSFASMTIAVILIVYYVLSPKPRERFDSLQALAYEALSYEDESVSNLDYPSDSSEDIRMYFAQNPRFTVKPVAFKSVPKDWQILGASVIDYDVAYISVVQYRNEKLKEMMFHFSYEGTLDDILASEEGNYQGFKYRAYASDRVNIIAWEQAKGLVAFLVGHRSAEDLAKIAHAGLGL